MRIHLGVVDVPYVESTTPEQRRSAKRAPRVNKDGTARKVSMREFGAHMKRGLGEDNPVETTGDVAMVLEGKYHVMEAFLASRIEQVGDALAGAMMASLENQAIGGPSVGMGDAEEFIGQQFREFLDSSEIEGMGLPGVPTEAAIKGVNPRLKLKRGPRRPSFVASGLYRQSFKAWTEE